MQANTRASRPKPLVNWAKMRSPDIVALICSVMVRTSINGKSRSIDATTVRAWLNMLPGSAWVWISTTMRPDHKRLRVRQVESRWGLTAQIRISGVGGNADDLDRCVYFIRIGFKGLAYGVLVGKELPRQGAIHHCDLGRGGRIVNVEAASLQNWDAHRLKEIRSYVVGLHAHGFRLHWPAGDMKG